MHARLLLVEAVSVLPSTSLGAGTSFTWLRTMYQLNLAVGDCIQCCASWLVPIWAEENIIGVILEIIPNFCSCTDGRHRHTWPDLLKRSLKNSPRKTIHNACGSSQYSACAASGVCPVRSPRRAIPIGCGYLPGHASVLRKPGTPYSHHGFGHCVFSRAQGLAKG